jgi:hypothetical protein
VKANSLCPKMSPYRIRVNALTSERIYGNMLTYEFQHIACFLFAARIYENGGRALAVLTKMCELKLM